MSAPLRFLMIVSAYPPFKSAGMETGCQRLSEALVRRGHSVTVLTQYTKSIPATRIEADGVIVHRWLRPIAIGPLWGMTYMGQVASYLLSHHRQFDVVVGQKLSFHSSVMGALRHRLSPRLCNLLVNAGSFSDITVLRRHKGGEWLLRKALACDGNFHLSRQSRAELMAENFPSNRLHPFRYMVNLQKFSPAPDALTDSPPELLFLGRFHPQKNLPLLLDAFEDPASRVLDLRLRLIGKGPEHDALIQRIDKHPYRDRITVQQWTDDPASAYRKALAVVISSDAEGLSNVMVEALACGTPVISTDVSGARDGLDPSGTTGDAPLASGNWVAPGGGGLLVPLRDRAALASAMDAVALDPLLRARLSKQARERAEVAFGEEACVNLFLDGIKQIMDSERNNR